MDVFDIIHIGKCGGTTVTTELDNHDIPYNLIHMTKFEYNPNTKYLIIIRNPIQRFISAINWRYRLVCITREQKGRFNNEYNLLKKYKSIDHICEDIQNDPDIFSSDPESCKYIHQLKEDIHFYLRNFINECSQEQILGVICTETLKQDMKQIFDIDITKHEKKNNTLNKKISNTSKEILQSYLQKDYDIVDKMYKYGWITSEKYSILRN